jgi:hypothetical protein
VPLGITPARGPWEYIRSPITSLAQGQFQKGDLVTSGVGRLVSLHTASNNTFVLGVATHDSLDSLPAGYAIIAYPAGPNCTAYVDTLPTEARSNLSFGEAGSIVSFGGRTSTFSKLATSVWSRTVQIRTAEQPINSADSRIEVMVIQGSLLMASTSSASLLV